jgi:uroporphyrinogen III methyltransferase/synthase
MPEISPVPDAPLENLRVLVLASPQTSGKLTAVLESWGARVLPFRAIEIHKLQDRDAFHRVIGRLKEYAWIIFTSSYGVRYFLEHLADLGVHKQQIGQVKICAVGPATARTAAENNLRVDLVPEEFVAEGILKALKQQPGGLGALKGCRILMPRAKEARDVLPLELTASGATVDVLACYETARAEVSSRAVRDLITHPPDLTVFTSASNVANFMAIVGPAGGSEIMRKSVVAVLGPITAAAVEARGKKPEIIPPENTVPSLEEAIRAFYSKRGNVAPI